MAQQTAVDWLREQYVHITWMVNRDELPTDNVFEFMLNRFEQAKQMEREQKIGLLKWMNKVSEVDPMRLETDHDDIVEQYYNETYNQNK